LEIGLVLLKECFVKIQTSVFQIISLFIIINYLAYYFSIKNNKLFIIIISYHDAIEDMGGLYKFIKYFTN